MKKELYSKLDKIYYSYHKEGEIKLFTEKDLDVKDPSEYTKDIVKTIIEYIKKDMENNPHEKDDFGYPTEIHIENVSKYVMLYFLEPICEYAKSHDKMGSIMVHIQIANKYYIDMVTLVCYENRNYCSLMIENVIKIFIINMMMASNNCRKILLA